MHNEEKTQLDGILMLLVLSDYCLNIFEYPLGAYVVRFYGI